VVLKHFFLTKASANLHYWSFLFNKYQKSIEKRWITTTKTVFQVWQKSNWPTVIMTRSYRQGVILTRKRVSYSSLQNLGVFVGKIQPQLNFNFSLCSRPHIPIIWLMSPIYFCKISHKPISSTINCNYCGNIEQLILGWHQFASFWISGPIKSQRQLS
jgi:hypothetical protein